MTVIPCGTPTAFIFKLLISSPVSFIPHIRQMPRPKPKLISKPKLIYSNFTPLQFSNTPSQPKCAQQHFGTGEPATTESQPNMSSSASKSSPLRAVFATSLIFLRRKEDVLNVGVKMRWDTTESPLMVKEVGRLLLRIWWRTFERLTSDVRCWIYLAWRIRQFRIGRFFLGCTGRFY